MTPDCDIAIVGAGSAGAIVAYRLAEAGYRVIVIEAGPPDHNPFIKVPAGFMKTLFDPRITWQMTQNPAPELRGREIPVILGRTWGGSSSVNGMIYNRGQAADFDDWAALGNDGWSHADVLPFFRRSESWAGAEDALHRGAGGPLAITTPRWPSAASDAFAAAAMAAGLRRNPDYNGAAQDGVGPYQSAIRRGRRVSTADAFLRPAIRRHGVRVISRARVTAIAFEGRRATGVHFVRDGQDSAEQVTAARAVVLSAGAVNTPRLLQLSGIGAVPLLRAQGIAPLIDLPGVGENLRDHYSPRIVARLRDSRHSMNGRERGVALAGQVLRWMAGKPNILGLSPALIHAFASSDPAMERPDFALVFTPASYRRGYIGQLDTYPGVTCGAWVMRPESRGFVRIASPDWRAPPQIDAAYLTDERDRALTVAALRFARGLLTSAAMRAVIAVETFPGPDCRSDQDWLDFARAEGNSSNHLVGTARMGAEGDPMAVLDPRLRLRGAGALRVIDSSVMPTMVSANTWAASMMIGEKGAAMLIEDLGR